MREAVDPRKGGFVAAGDFREQLQEDRPAVLLSGRGLRRRVHHGFPSSIVCRPAPDIHGGGRMSPIRSAGAKSFGRQHVSHDFLAPGLTARLETPAG